MDALEMLKTAKRCCKSEESCCDCGLGGESCLFDSPPEHMDMERMSFTVAFLEAWESKNPLKTRAELFLERNPEAKRNELYPNVPDVRPCDYDESINYPAHCCCGDTCDDCRKKYWEEPVE